MPDTQLTWNQPDGLAVLDICRAALRPTPVTGAGLAVMRGHGDTDPTLVAAQIGGYLRVRYPECRHAVRAGLSWRAHGHQPRRCLWRRM